MAYCLSRLQPLVTGEERCVTTLIGLFSFAAAKEISVHVMKNINHVASPLPWVPEVFLVRGGNFRCRHIFGRRPMPRVAT